MRMIPVKTRPTLRRVRVKFLMWEIALRMREQHGNPDVWLLESPEPIDGSPWQQTRVCGRGVADLGVGSVVDVAKVEVRTRLDAVHDYFGGAAHSDCRTAVPTRFARCAGRLSRPALTPHGYSTPRLNRQNGC